MDDNHYAPPASAAGFLAPPEGSGGGQNLNKPLGIDNPLVATPSTGSNTANQTLTPNMAYRLAHPTTPPRTEAFASEPDDVRMLRQVLAAKRQQDIEKHKVKVKFAADISTPGALTHEDKVRMEMKADMDAASRRDRLKKNM